MKKKFKNLYSAMFLSLLGAMCVSVSGGNQYVTTGLMLFTFCISLFILSNWMSYVKNLVSKSDQVLNYGKRDLRWSFANLEKLKKNQDLIQEKFKASATMIADLAHPERIVSTQRMEDNDPISKALSNIREEMLKIKSEDDKRAWVTQGIAQFGDILRNKTAIEEYGQTIVSNLVRYIGANQGGLFIEYETESHERYLKMMGCYAYGKRKQTESRIEEGQGLVGQCMLEKEFILMTNVPDSYAKITSGLGEATPTNIVVAPLIFKDTFCGVIELAFIEAIESHHIEFLKKICESIASEIVSLKNVEQTEKLLEDSNVLMRELQSREEIMKQNLEELAATQEEMLRRQTELTGIINAIDSTLATAEFDVKGNILKHNIILERFLKLTSHQLIQKNYALITGTSDDERLWNKILNGQLKAGDFKTTSGNGTDVWLSMTFTPILDTNGQTIRILSMIQDITQKRIKEKEFEKLSLVANNTDNSVIITDSAGLIEYVNEGFTKMTGYEANEVLGKKPGAVLQGPHTDAATVKKLRAQMALGVPIYEEILNYNKKGDSYWISLAINPVKDEHGAINKFISIQADITETKSRALDFHQKMQALSRSNAILELDKHGKLIDINDKYLDLLGYKREELVGQPYTVLTRKENIIEKMMDEIKSVGMQNGVFTRYNKNGNRHWMKLIDYPVLDLDGELVKIIEFGVDVSNEKRLEKEAARKQSELNSYLNGVNNTIASAEFGLDGHFENANEIFLKVMGFSKEELKDTLFPFLMGEDPSVIMMWENLRLGRFFSGEFKMRNKAGKELWLNGTFNPIIIEEGAPEKIMMLAQFTTQEKEKLNDLTTMVNALKSTLPVMEFNADLTCKTANEKTLKIFGLSRLDLRSKSVLDFLAPEYHAHWLTNNESILTASFSSFLLPFQVGTSVVHYEVSVSVTRNLDGSVGKIIMLLVKKVEERILLEAM